MKGVLTILLLLAPIALCQDKMHAEGTALLARAEKGDAAAQNELGARLTTGKWTPLDYTEFARWSRLLANQGDTEAQFHLGQMYSVGNGVQENSIEAVSWYRKAADQGHVLSQYELGAVYRDGSGDHRVRQNYAEAARWFHKAADQGDVDSQWALGLMYYGGQGVAQDYVAAHVWMNIAAARTAGDKHKKYAEVRDALGAIMTPAQIAEAQRLVREWKPTSEAKVSKPIK